MRSGVLCLVHVVRLRALKTLGPNNFRSSTLVWGACSPVQELEISLRSDLQVLRCFLRELGIHRSFLEIRWIILRTSRLTSNPQVKNPEPRRFEPSLPFRGAQDLLKGFLKPSAWARSTLPPSAGEGRRKVRPIALLRIFLLKFR